MSKQQHTPGPWFCDIAHENEDEWDVYGGTIGRYRIAEVLNGNGYEENKSNARLIAAAPELLIAAQMALQTLADRKLDGGMVGATLHEAIAKATGA